MDDDSAAGSEDPLREYKSGGSSLFGKSAELLKETTADETFPDNDSIDDEVVLKYPAEDSNDSSLEQQSPAVGRLLDISGAGNDSQPSETNMNGTGRYLNELSSIFNGSAVTNESQSQMATVTVVEETIETVETVYEQADEGDEPEDYPLVIDRNEKPDRETALTPQEEDEEEAMDWDSSLRSRKSTDGNKTAGDKTLASQDGDPFKDEKSSTQITPDTVESEDKKPTIEDGDVPEKQTIHEVDANESDTEDLSTAEDTSTTAQKTSPRRGRGGRRGRLPRASQTSSSTPTTPSSAAKSTRRSSIQKAEDEPVATDSPRVLRTRSSVASTTTASPKTTPVFEKKGPGRGRKRVVQEKEVEADETELKEEEKEPEEENPAPEEDEEEASDGEDQEKDDEVAVKPEKRQLRTSRTRRSGAVEGNDDTPTTPEMPVRPTRQWSSEGRPARGRGSRGGRRGGGRTGDNVMVLDDMNLDAPTSSKTGGSGRRSAYATKSTPAGKKTASAQDDPYSLENMNVHPEPLRNIQVDRGSFGQMRFTKSAPVGGGATSSSLSFSARYANTEKAATERLSSMPNSSPLKKTPTQVSISEMSPVLRKEMSGGRKVKKARRSKPTGLFADVEEHEEAQSDDEEDQEEDEEEMHTGDEGMEESEDFPEMVETTVKRRGRPSAAAAAADHSALIISPRGKSGRKPGPTTTTPSSRTGERQSRQRYNDAEINVSGRRLMAATAPVEVPELSAEEQLHVDHPSNHHIPLLPGARVFALWDKIYYPAHVVSRDGLGRYKVKFVEDECVRDVPPTGLIPLNALGVGAEVSMSDMVNGESVIEPVEIRTVPSFEEAQEWMEGVYEVLNPEDQEIHKILWTKIVVDASQAKPLLLTRVNTAAQVATDNIDEAEGRIRRRTRRPSRDISPGAAEPKTPSTDHSSSAIRQTRDSGSSRSSGAKRGASAAVDASDAPLAKKRAVGRPAKHVNAHLLSGRHFVLTSANRRIRDPDEVIVPFNKREIRQMIEARGGQVMDDLSHLDSTQNVYLIADTHYRTHKYLSALARGVPCVNHVWIIECVKQEKLVPHEKFMLPAGISLQSEEIVPWHANNNNLLAGKRVLVHTQNVQPTQIQTFVQIWSPLVAYMGADILPEMPDDDGGKLDILLTDITCTPEYLERAHALGAIAVSSEWLIQAIILGQLPPATGHERYRYDYTEPPAGVGESMQQ